jgi:hypothetical protein
MEVTDNPSPVHVVDKPDFSSVRTFVLFVGYPRSGHSLIGSIMDAHPNIIIAHEVLAALRHVAHTHLIRVLLFCIFVQYDVVGKLDSYISDDGKTRLYNDLFQDSKNMAFREGGRQHNNYKYALHRFRGT